MSLHPESIAAEIQNPGVVYGRDAVKYTPQALTDEQKRQARENIDAASSEQVNAAQQAAAGAQKTAAAKLDKENPTGAGRFAVGGRSVAATGNYSHAEGNAVASGAYAHAEGSGTASGDLSHAEGALTKSIARYSHAEGFDTVANGENSHAEGYRTTANSNAHAEGNNTNAAGGSSHAEGDNTEARGVGSHAEGYATVATRDYSHVQGYGNVIDLAKKYVHIVGGGNGPVSSGIYRRNLHTIDASGNAWFSGNVWVNSSGGRDKDDGSKKLATEEYADSKGVPAAENSDEGKILKIVDGKPVWADNSQSEETKPEVWLLNENLPLSTDDEFLVEFTSNGRVFAGIGTGEGNLYYYIGEGGVTACKNSVWADPNYRKIIFATPPTDEFLLEWLGNNAVKLDVNSAATPYTTLRRKKNFVRVMLHDLDPLRTYSLHLYTASRRGGSKYGVWQHPPNYDATGNGNKYGLKYIGYADVAGKAKSGTNPVGYWPQAPAWMPHGGKLQTEWAVKPDADYVEIDCRAWLLDLLRPAGDFSFYTDPGNPLRELCDVHIAGISSSAHAARLFQFCLVDDLGAAFPARNTLRIGPRFDAADNGTQVGKVKGVEPVSSNLVTLQNLFISIK